MIAVTASTSLERVDRWAKSFSKFEDDIDFYAWDNFPENIGMVPAYQKLYQEHRSHPTIVFMHDDCEIHDPDWPAKVEAEFADPKVAVVGLGGALGLGDPDSYKVPYNLNQLARKDYFSNQTDWQVHGQRETGSRNVVVVDGFFMAIRTGFLDEIGGWSDFPYTFHMYDAYICLKALERGYRVRMTGISCTHHGGGTSTSPEYIDWCRERGTTPEREHELPHRFIYESFREVLPVRV